MHYLLVLTGLIYSGSRIRGTLSDYSGLCLADRGADVERERQDKRDSKMPKLIVLIAM